jgi:hypothetical protein
MAQPQFDPTQPFTAAPAFDPTKPFTAATEPTPDFRATNEPPSTSLKAAAYGKDALQLALDALPGAGAVVGGVLSTPETLGAGTLVGAALGAGAGRGLRDLIAAGLGLQKPTTALAEGGVIALDVAETYAAGRILPALWAAIKAPGATVADVYEGVRGVNNTLPHLLRWKLPKLPRGVGKAPATILERPAWQTWSEHLPADAQPSPPLAHTTGTSMIPAAVPRPPPMTVEPPMATPAPTPATAAPPIATPAPAPSTAAIAEEDRLFQELRETIARRQVAAPPAAMEATSPFAQPVAPPVSDVADIPAPRMGPDGRLVGRPGGNPDLPNMRAENEAAIAVRRAAYEASLQPNAGAVVKASGKLHFTAPEWAAFRELRTRGLSLEDAASGAKAAGQLARQFGLSTPTLEQTRFPKGMRGAAPAGSTTLAADVAPESVAAPRAGDLARGRDPQLPDAAALRVQSDAERAARAGARKAARDASRADARQYEHDDLAALVTKAQADGYTGDPAVLHRELADRLQGIKELHAEFDESGQHGLTLLRAIAKEGGLSLRASEAAGQRGEVAWLKEFQDTQAPKGRRGNLAKPNVISGQVRGVRGVFQEGTQQTRGGRAGGQTLGGMLERLKQDPRFSHITTENELSDAIRSAATGLDDTANAIADLRANSHDLIGRSTPHAVDDPIDSFDPIALEAESQAAAARRARKGKP